MTRYRFSYGEVMSKLIEEHGKSKSQEFFNDARDAVDYVLECEINNMTNAQLIDLMEQAGVIRVDPKHEP